MTICKADERRMGKIDRIHLAHPEYGARKVARELTEAEMPTSRSVARRLMRQMNVRACCPRPSLSAPSKHSKRFPYLLHGKSILFPNQVWSTDITYVQIGRRHMYLTAVIDWHSRYVVGWRLSDTMRACEVCACARSAFSAHGTPACMNSDQGSVFGSDDYVGLLAGEGIRQSMDGKARWRDNVIMERWFRTLKSECLRNSEYETPRELESIIARFVTYYNNERIHQSLGYDVPADWYAGGFPEAA
jgi:putative transposase